MPLFSTIIPVYNRAELAAAAIESALAQEFADQEIIVVDDGSTDDTPNAGPLWRSHPRFATGKPWPRPARNLGIQHAAGQYVTFLDSDDLWFPWTLRMYREAIQRYQQPGFCGGACRGNWLRRTARRTAEDSVAPTPPIRRPNCIAIIYPPATKSIGLAPARWRFAPIGFAMSAAFPMSMSTPKIPISGCA